MWSLSLKVDLYTSSLVLLDFPLQALTGYVVCWKKKFQSVQYKGRILGRNKGKSLSFLPCYSLSPLLIDFLLEQKWIENGL